MAIPQYAAIANTQPTTYAVIAMSVPGGYLSGPAGSGYTVGDVITMVGGTYTRPATAIVRAVTTGGAPQFYGLELLDGGAYSAVPSNFNATTGGTGTGLNVGVLATAVPCMTWRTYSAVFPDFTGSGGFPGYLSQFTISVWTQRDCDDFHLITQCLSQWAFSGPWYDDGVMELISGIIFFNHRDVPTARPFDSAPNTDLRYTESSSSSPPKGPYNLYSHTLISVDFTTQTFQAYLDDQQCVTNELRWGNAGLPNNPSDSIWIIRGYQDHATGFAALWMAPTFMDLSIVANRRIFINPDGSPTDFSTLPPAPHNLYIDKGEGPNAIATNHGSQGDWRIFEGPMTWCKGNCTPSIATGPHHIYVQFRTPFSFHLLHTGDSHYQGQVDNPSNPDYDYRPGATPVYELLTEPTLGTLVFDQYGNYTYTPNSDAYNTTDSFTYKMTEVMPAGYQQPGLYATGTVNIQIGSPDSGWIVSSGIDLDDAGVGELWLQNDYTDFNDPAVRSQFLNPDGSWKYLGYYGQLPTGISPQNWLMIPPGWPADTFLWNFGQFYGGSSWNELKVGVDPATDQPYPNMVYDLCTPELKLVSLYPFDQATSEYSFTALSNFDTSFSHFAISVWCCQNVHIQSPDSPIGSPSITMDFSPSQMVIALHAVDGSLRFSGTWTVLNPSIEYQVLFSVDTMAQTYSLYVNNAAPIGVPTWGSTGPIGWA